MKKTTLISIAPFMFFEGGHGKPYHLSLQNIAGANNWSFKVAIPKVSVLEKLPANWSKTLHTFPNRHIQNPDQMKAYKGPRKYQRFARKFLYPFSIFCYLLKHFLKNKSTHQTIVLLEHAHENDIRPLLHCLRFLPKKNTYIALLYREDQYRTPAHAEVKVLNQKLISLLGKTHLKLFTDSTKINHRLTSYFGLTLITLPIPHVEDIPLSIKQSSSNDLISCWWPGSVRRSKGLGRIEDLCRVSSANAKKLKIIAAKSSHLVRKSDYSPQIELLDDNIEREHYLYWLSRCDIILLPYICSTYESSTSGIFLEAIIAGKPCAVPENTWMADELNKHDIHELIIHWHKKNVPEKLIRIVQNKHLHKKIKKMQAHYLTYHHPKTFAKILKKAFDEHQTSATLISLIPFLFFNIGHFLPYNLAMSKIAKQNHWDHLAALPKKSCVDHLPKAWKKCLHIDLPYFLNDPNNRMPYIRKKRWVRYAVHALYTITLFRFLKNALKQKSDNKVIFLEEFQFAQLLALANCIKFLPKKGLHVCILYRHNPKKIGKEAVRYIPQHKRIAKYLGNHFHLLTDTDLLADSLSLFFQQSFTIMPIPHTEYPQIKYHKNHNDPIICWWPGEARPAKGLDRIEYLSTLTNKGAKSIQIIAAKNSFLTPHPEGPLVKLLENNLGTEEYAKWMALCDLVLLPYDIKAYQNASSGIFVEAICMGKIPLVRGNWMTRELKKYDLEELIMDWYDHNLIQKLIEIAKSDRIKSKMKKIQKSYQDFHNISSYATIMQTLIQKVK